RELGNGQYRAVVRDFKARGEVVDPALDLGVLVRAVWVILELRHPRCRWFLAGRNLPIDPDAVDVATVNLMFAAGGDFLGRATLSADRLLRHCDRLVESIARMGETLAAASPS